MANLQSMLTLSVKRKTGVLDSQPVWHCRAKQDPISQADFHPGDSHRNRVQRTVVFAATRFVTLSILKSDKRNLDPDIK